jgi:hypothetical protein
MQAKWRGCVGLEIAPFTRLGAAHPDTQVRVSITSETN